MTNRSSQVRTALTAHAERRRLALLAAGAFVVTVDGTLVIGLLEQIARSLRISPAAAGQSVTAFAVSYALSAPLVIRLTRRVRPELLLVASLGGVALGNAATAAAPGLAALILARVVAAACAGVFMATSATVAAQRVAVQRRGRALASVVGGASAGTALGVPIGTFLGGIAGWRTLFFGICGMTIVVSTATAMSVSRGSDSLESTAHRARNTRALWVLSTTLLWSSGSFVFFTYIAVVIRQATSVGTAGLSLFLMLFGLAGISGAVLAGRSTDARGAAFTLLWALTAIVAALTGLGFVVAVGLRGAAATSATAIALIAYGVGTWAVTPPQQHLLLEASDDRRTLLSLNASALYGGVALGSTLGGAILARSHSSAAICWVGAGIEFAALGSVAVQRRFLSGAARGVRGA